MTKLVPFIVLLALFGCVHYDYKASEELKRHPIDNSRLSGYDLTIGVQCKDKTVSDAIRRVEDDLAAEFSVWLSDFLDQDKKFKKVVDLNKHPGEQTDVILKCLIKSLIIEEPGVSVTSKVLAIFYGVAPVLEHYALPRKILASATIRYQLIDQKSQKIIWEQTLTEKNKENTELASSGKVVFAAIAKTAEALLTETRFPEELTKIGNKTYLAASTASSQIPRFRQGDHGKIKMVEQRWAVIIGISEYQDTRIPSLRYASEDAKAFYDWIISPNGGGYAPSRVKLFLDRQATGQNMKNALFAGLKQTLEEDMVIIYFAGHGAPDSPDSADNLFLLPHDADYDNIAGTGFPMWDVETAMKRFINAKKIVIIADACHSGGVGQSFDIARRANRGIKVNAISSGLQNLSNIGDGVCVISASGDKQFSQESKDWGGGHGVFTYFLLKALRGEADYDKDNITSLGELVPFLSQQVRRATQSAQCPTVAGKFDPALSIGR